MHPDPPQPCRPKLCACGLAEHAAGFSGHSRLSFQMVALAIAAAAEAAPNPERSRRWPVAGELGPGRTSDNLH